MTSPFILNEKGWHAATRRAYVGRMRDLVTSDTAEGDSYRNLFLRELQKCPFLGEWTERLTGKQEEG